MERELIEGAGYGADCTPIDTLMADEGLGLYVGGSMLDDDYPEDDA